MRRKVPQYNVIHNNAEYLFLTHFTIKKLIYVKLTEKSQFLVLNASGAKQS